jgi:hypothetical protein
VLNIMQAKSLGSNCVFNSPTGGAMDIAASQFGLMTLPSGIRKSIGAMVPVHTGKSQKPWEYKCSAA